MNRESSEFKWLAIGALVIAVFAWLPLLLGLVGGIAAYKFRQVRPWMLFACGSAILLFTLPTFGLYRDGWIGVVDWLFYLALNRPVDFPWKSFLGMWPLSIGAGGIISGAVLWLIRRRWEYLGLPLDKPEEEEKRLSPKRLHKMLKRLESMKVEDGTALGVDVETGQPYVLRDDQANKHVFVVGATGAGKTNTLSHIIQSAIRRGLGIVILDAKGDPEFRRAVERLAGKEGRAFRSFSYDGMTAYNPLRHGNPTELKDKLIAVETWSEPHYQRAAERYLQMVFRVMKEMGARPDLYRVSKMLMPDMLIEAADKFLPKERARDIIQYVESLGNDQISAIKGLGSRLALLVESDVGHLFTDDRNAIDLLESVRQRDVVMFSLEGIAYSSFTPMLGAMIVEDLKTVVGAIQAEGGARGYTYLIMDEFNIFAGPQVVNLLNKSRGAGFCCVLATQELADLEAGGGKELVNQVIGNTNIKIIHRQDVPDSAEYLSSVAGTERSYQKTLQTEETLLSKKATRLGTVRDVEAFIVHPNRLKKLAVGEAVVIQKVPKLDVCHIRVPEFKGVSDYNDTGSMNDSGGGNLLLPEPAEKGLDRIKQIASGIKSRLTF